MTTSYRPAGAKRRLVAGAAVYLAVLAAVGLALLRLHASAAASLERALGERLLGVATTAAHLVDGDSLQVWALDPQETLDFVWMRSRLQEVRRENRLSELTLCDREGFVLVSAADRVARGDLDYYWELDPAAVASALGGAPEPGSLVKVGDEYQKSAFAPVWTADGRVAGVLSVDAEAEYFRALGDLRRVAWLSVGAVLVFLSAMALVVARLERSLAGARAAAQRQETLVAMGRMTAGIAHEIRNPLGIIRGAGEIQTAKLRELGVELPTADFIPEEVDRLDRILTRYLTFGHGGAPRPEPLDLEALVRRVARMAAGELERRGVRIEVENRGVAGPIAGDSPGLQQVLLNLLLNARDAMPGGGVVTIVLAPRGDGVELRVRDEGDGLGGRSQDELFAPFFTTRQQGSGLGLAVVRQVIEDHGGTLALRDRDDGPGAEAVVVLPRGETPEAPWPAS
ncbi:MAG: ATP-binding protein [bacterium]|nr:ATP-binding protein [bacterium]